MHSSTDLASFHGILFFGFLFISSSVQSNVCFRISKLYGLCVKEETSFVEMHIWCIKIIIVLVLYFNPWVEASAGGLLIPEGFYSPVATYFGTSWKYGYELNC
jgi:hypothetical protein